MWLRRIFPSDNSGDADDAPEELSVDGEDVFLRPETMRQLNRLSLTASRFLRGDGIGLRSSFRRKPASDFLEHRKYVPGDDPRHVDWKASARQDQIFVKQGEHPKEATVSILLDCSASMAWGNPRKMSRQLSLAAAIGYVTLSNADRLLVRPIGQAARSAFGPVTGKAQFPALLRYLRSIDYSGTMDLEQEVSTFRTVNRGGLVLLISDLLGTENLEACLEKIPAPTWDVVVMHLLHPEELEPSPLGRVEMVDVETGRRVNYDVDGNAVDAYVELMASWREDLELTCVEQHAFYTLIRADWDLDADLLPHLRSVNVLSVT